MLRQIYNRFRSGSGTMLFGVFFMMAFFAFIMMFAETYSVRENYLNMKAATDTIADGTALYASENYEADYEEVSGKASEIASVIDSELGVDVGTVSTSRDDFENDDTVSVSTEKSHSYITNLFFSAPYAMQASSGTHFTYSFMRMVGDYVIVGSGKGLDVAEYALQFVGNPYVWAGTSLTDGCDCSGFVMSVYAHFGVSLPHSSAADRYVGKSVSWDEMQAGDIICFNENSLGISHVGIYCGNGMMVDAKGSKFGIVYEPVTPDTHNGVVAINRIFVDE